MATEAPPNVVVSPSKAHKALFSAMRGRAVHANSGDSMMAALVLRVS